MMKESETNGILKGFSWITEEDSFIEVTTDTGPQIVSSEEDGDVITLHLEYPEKVTENNSLLCHIPAGTPINITFPSSIERSGVMIARLNTDELTKTKTTVVKTTTEALNGIEPFLTEDDTENGPITIYAIEDSN